MRRIDYNAEESGNTETHIAVDEKMRNQPAELQDDFQDDLEEGFASASGVRNETAATGGRVKHPETKDEDRTNRLSHRAPNPVEDENAGLADN